VTSLPGQPGSQTYSQLPRPPADSLIHARHMGAVHEWAFSSRRVVVVESLASRRAAPARLTLCCNLRVVTVTHVPPPTKRNKQQPYVRTYLHTTRTHLVELLHYFPCPCCSFRAQCRDIHAFLKLGSITTGKYHKN
jgi:hypothetical protein